MPTINVTKVSVIETQPKLYAVTLNLKANDGAIVLIDQDFTENHKIGNSVDYSINKFKAKMQAAIGKYIAEQNILNSTQLDSAILILKGGLIWQ